MRRGRYWRTDEIAMAAMLYRANARVGRGAQARICRDIAAAIGRTTNQVRMRLHLHGPTFSGPAIKRASRPVPQIERRTASSWNASADAVADCARRNEAAARRTLTASILGDPPPGYSALDRSRRA